MWMLVYMFPLNIPPTHNMRFPQFHNQYSFRILKHKYNEHTNKYKAINKTIQLLYYFTFYIKIIFSRFRPLHTTHNEMLIEFVLNCDDQ